MLPNSKVQLCLSLAGRRVATWVNECLAAPRGNVTAVVEQSGSGGEQKEIDDFVERAKKGGWLTAGTWYWTIAAKSLEVQNLSKSTFQATAIAAEQIVEFEQGFLPRLAQAQVLLESMELNYGNGRSGQTLPDSRAGSSGDGLFGKVGEVWGQTFGVQTHVWHSAILKDNDPIRTLAGYGQWMIAGGTAVIAAAAFSKASAASGEKSIVGQGANLVGAGGGWSLVNFAATMLTVLAAWLIGMGGMLAYYLPAVPFLYFSFAILGWIIMIVESMLAAPLWAASHAVPEGDGFAGRYALQGWQLFLNVILRPIMLTIGIFVSMFVMHAIIQGALYGYFIFNHEMVNSTASTALWGFIFTNMIMVGLVIVLAHKAHEIIYDTADNVMRWIGFGVSPLGAVKAEGEVKGLAHSGSATTERFVGAGLGKIAGDDKAKRTTQPANQAGGTPVTQRTKHQG